MNKHAGFTLIEVLIAMLILTIGLLGLAALQATSLKNNQSAYYRSQATQLAYDIADRMRVNTSVSKQYLSDTMMPEDAQDQSDYCLNVTATCTPEKMAQHDLFEWNATIQAILPNDGPSSDNEHKATGRIAEEKGAYTVTIEWNESRDNNHDETPDKKTTFSVGFRL